MKYGLPQDIIDSIKECLLANDRIEQVILYGSRAKGNYHTGSDIDLALKGNSLISNDIYRLEDCLDDLLLPYRFDISLYHQIDNPDLIHHINQVGLPFFEPKKELVSH